MAAIHKFVSCAAAQIYIHSMLRAFAELHRSIAPLATRSNVATILQEEGILGNLQDLPFIDMHAT